MKRLGLFLLLAMAVAAPAQQGERGQGERRGQRQLEPGANRPPGTNVPANPQLPLPGTAVAPLNVVPVSTDHTITYHGAPLAYTATAGSLALKTDEGETDGSLFFVAYTKKGEDPSTRPITFVYNGGPGSSSVFVHLGTMGPRRVALNDDGTMPKPPFKLVDNQETWLASTDIVAVDAMGTGFSRPTSAENGRKFYGVQGDLDGFGRFIQTYLAKYRRYGSPIFLAGESYGGIRTAGLSGWLIDRGVALNGAIIISGVENEITLNGGRGNDVPFMGYLPSFCATAWYHKRLSPRLEKSLDATLAECEKFTLGEYASALAAGSSLDAARQKAVAEKLSEYTGIPEDYIVKSHLRITPAQFFKQELREKGLVVGRYDARLTGEDASDLGDRAEFDPSDAAVTPTFNSAINQYLTGELNLDVPERYRLNNYGSGWDYGPGGRGYPDVSDSLRQAMQKNPHMKLLFVCGRYDLACPYFAQQFTVNHLDLRPDQRARVSFDYYLSGHMVYIERGSREKLARDIDGWYAAAK